MDMPKMELSEVVLKSRRNLILLSFASLALFAISPDTLDLKALGFELKTLQIKNVKYLLLGAILIESLTFYTRCHVSFANNKFQFLSLHARDIEEYVNKTCANRNDCTNTECKLSIVELKQEIRAQKKVLHDSWSNFFSRSILFELYAPTMLALVAISLSVYEDFATKYFQNLKRSDVLIYVIYTTTGLFALLWLLNTPIVKVLGKFIRQHWGNKGKPLAQP